MQHYMESFEEHFLNGRIRYNTEVLKIRRVPEKNGKASSASSAALRWQWLVSVHDEKTGATADLKYDRLVLCSGVRCHSLLGVAFLC